jgi:iron complex outermembrane receptor protein
MRNRNVRQWLVFTAVTCSFAGAAAAADADNPDATTPDRVGNGGLEEIIVTARRRQEDLQQVPVSIAVVTGKELEARGIDDQIELNRMVPDLVIHGSNGFFGLQEGGFGMRGIQDVSIYYDGIAHPETFGVPAGDILEVDHVEVLRGPQGTLFGKDTMGGAIQYVTKPPADTFGARVKLTTGSYDRYDATVYVDLPITSTLLSKLTLAKLTKGGYVQSTTNGTYTDRRTTRWPTTTSCGSPPTSSPGGPISPTRMNSRMASRAPTGQSIRGRIASIRRPPRRTPRTSPACTTPSA